MNFFFIILSFRSPMFFQSLSQFLFLSVSVSLIFCLALLLSVSYLCASVLAPVCFFFCLSVCFFVSISVSLCLSLCASMSRFLPLCVSLSLSVCIFLCFFVSVLLCFDPCLCLSVCLSHLIPSSSCPSLSLSFYFPFPSSIIFSSLFSFIPSDVSFHPLCFFLYFSSLPSSLIPHTIFFPFFLLDSLALLSNLLLLRIITFAWESEGHYYTTDLSPFLQFTKFRVQRKILKSTG